MAIGLAHETSSLARYIEEIRSAWDNGKDPRLPSSVGALMESLFASTSPEEPWMAKLIREAKPAVKEVHRLSPGVAHPYLAGEIHSTHAVEGPAVVFRFLSYDLEKIERYRYNLETGAVTRA